MLPALRLSESLFYIINTLRENCHYKIYTKLQTDYIAEFKLLVKSKKQNPDDKDFLVNLKQQQDELTSSHNCKLKVLKTLTILIFDKLFNAINDKNMRNINIYCKQALSEVIDNISVKDQFDKNKMAEIL